MIQRFTIDLERNKVIRGSLSVCRSRSVSSDVRLFAGTKKKRPTTYEDPYNVTTQPETFSLKAVRVVRRRKDDSVAI